MLGKWFDRSARRTLTRAVRGQLPIDIEVVMEAHRPNGKVLLTMDVSGATFTAWTQQNVQTAQDWHELMEIAVWLVGGPTERHIGKLRELVSPLQVGNLFVLTSQRCTTHQRHGGVTTERLQELEF